MVGESLLSPMEKLNKIEGKARHRPLFLGGAHWWGIASKTGCFAFTLCPLCERTANELDGEQGQEEDENPSLPISLLLS